MDVDFVDVYYGMAIGDYGYILTSTDGGAAWAVGHQAGDPLLTDFIIWDADKLYARGIPESLYRKTGGGANWNFNYNGNFAVKCFSAKYRQDENVLLMMKIRDGYFAPAKVVNLNRKSVVSLSGECIQRLQLRMI